MSESGHGLQIVNVTGRHSFELDETKLLQLLLDDAVKDLPVVVVSVAGAYRGGKSFLLNFFLRYLSSPPSARQDGSWLGEDSEPLAGFRWRSGIKATTMGVLMWSEPFITTLPDGQKVAVLLVDTQGTFDNRSTVRDNSTIFALSTLISSVQIYNISHDIQEDDLQHLELFTEYGKLVNSASTKAFQVLEFLVRDWQFPEDYPYGASGGDRLLQEKIAITNDMPKEMQELRQHLTSSFEKVSCFLMPHPGFNVLKPNFDGKIKDIDRDFRTYLNELVNSIFIPEKLLPKKINGQQVKARDLFNYIKTYMELFNSDQIPSPTNILAATVKAVLLSAVGEAHDVYEKGMDSEVGPKKPGVPAADLKFIHKKYVTAATKFYNDKPKLGTSEEQTDYLNKLTTELNNRLPQFLQSNLSKIQIAIEKAMLSYQNTLDEVFHQDSICVHPQDLDKIHQTAVEAAIATYDGLIKSTLNSSDDDKTTFIQGFIKKLALMRLDNEQNNQVAVSILYGQYWQHMQGKISRSSPLSEASFLYEHRKTMAQTLRDFDSKRALHSHYNEDVYRSELSNKMTSGFNDLQSINTYYLEEIKRKEEEEERRRQEEERWRQWRRERERQREEEEERRRRRNQSSCSFQ